jgi:hypothetical protein
MVLPVLSLMSSLFDSFFGFIFWGVAYFRMRKADGSISLLKDRTFRGWFEGILNIVCATWKQRSQPGQITFLRQAGPRAFPPTPPFVFL